MALSSRPKARSSASPSPEAVQEFVAGAALPASKNPKKERATRSFLVRLNEYELDLLRQVAEQEDRSMHKVIKRLLIPALEQRLQ